MDTIVKFDEIPNIIDASLRIIIVLSLLAWNVFESLSLRTLYPLTMVALWESPVWRLILLFIVWLGAEWCESIGLMTAMAVSIYIVNMIQVA
jgi:hypothetical protein